VAQELVQRRVDQPDDDGQAVHRLVHLEEVALLEREQLRERCLSPVDRVGHDHVLHDRQTVRLPEHVLGPRETDALGAELARETALLRRVRVHPDAERPALIRPREKLDELLLLTEVRLDRR